MSKKAKGGHGGPHGGRPVTHHGNGKDNNNKDDNKNKHGAAHYGSYAGYKGVTRKDAAKLVNPEFHQLMRNLKHELQQTRREFKRSTKQENKDYGRTTDTLNTIYGNTGQYLQGLADQTGKVYGDLTSQQKAAQAALMQQLQGTTAQAQGDTNGELSRLGMDQAADPSQFLTQLNSDANSNSALAQIQGMNNQSNLDMMNFAAQQANNLALGSNQQSLAAGLNQALYGHQDAMTGIRDDFRDSRADVRNGMHDLKGQRADALNQMMAQLAQFGWGQYMDNRSQNFNQWLSKQQLGLDRRQLAMQNRQFNAGLAQDNAYYGTQSGLYQGALSNSYKHGGGNGGGGGGPVGPGSYHASGHKHRHMGNIRQGGPAQPDVNNHPYLP